ncbi:terminase small subunit [Pseudomonas helleri]|uniref:terminase small subunit n=1 Tax=Pseudomonas helleri TaxID=1608996 RepID=UPI003FD33DA2
MALTAKQQRFVIEYLVDLNATQAAIRAGYAAKGAKDQAYQLMQRPVIAAAIKEAMEARNQRTQVDADYVLNRLTEIDQMDLAAIHDDDGKLLPIKKWPLIWRQMVKEVDMKSGKVKFHDKLKALELIGKHVTVNAFRENINHSGSIDLTQMSDEELERQIAQLSDG